MENTGYKLGESPKDPDVLPESYSADNSNLEGTSFDQLDENEHPDGSIGIGGDK